MPVCGFLKTNLKHGLAKFTISMNDLKMMELNVEVLTSATLTKMNIC
jgi:hypothetical protein